MRALALLLGVAFLDEVAGVAYPSAPDIQSAMAISYGTAALAMFTIPQLVCMVVDPPLLLAASRWPRKPAVVVGLLAMGAALFATGACSGPWALAALTCAVWIGSGLGVGMTEAVLLDADLARQEQRMARWTLLGSLGDLCAPLLIAALSLAGASWRAGFFLVGAFIVAYALVLTRARFPPPDPVADGDEDEEEPSLRAAVGAALQNRPLLWWLFGAELCSLLDELFVAFGSLYLSVAFGASLSEIGGAMAVMMAGNITGLLVLERQLRRGRPPRRLLAVAAILCTSAFLLWLAAPGFWWCVAAMALLGGGISPLWPLATAQAHRALPGQAAMVTAVGTLFAPVGVILPILVGFLADAVGLSWALLVMLLQPLVLLALSLVAPRDT